MSRVERNAATAAVSRETSGIGEDETGGEQYSLDQGQIVERKGPDGTVKRVRIVVPPNLTQLSPSG
jgi:hypothetical protein